MFATGKVIPSNSDVMQVSYGDDQGLYVEFYWREVQNEAKTIQEGRPVFESKEYIKIISPADKTKMWDRPVLKRSNGVQPSDIDRFPRQWERFQRQEQQVMEGTPVTEWPQITRSDAASLKAMNIHTIEQLAALGDNNLNWLGARAIRDKAKNWLEKAKDGAAAAQWAKEKSELQAQIDALKNQMQGFGIQEASAPPAKRGRKPKVKHEQDISTAGTSGE